MKVDATQLPGVLVIEPQAFPDRRGFVFESYQAERYGEAGVPAGFVQDTHVLSVQRTLRGLHYQLARPQAKLIRVVRGAIWDVAVDVRRGSPTFGRWVAVRLTADNRRQLFIPVGMAHGFCVPEGEAEIEYKCSDYYVSGDQHGVAWNDPTLAIPWPVTDPLISEQDRALAPLRAARDDLPVYVAAGP